MITFFLGIDIGACVIIKIETHLFKQQFREELFLSFYGPHEFITNGSITMQDVIDLLDNRLAFHF